MMSTLITLHLRTSIVHSAITADCLLEVLRLELTVLIVAEGLLDRNSDNVENIRRLLEDVVHLLQRTAASLGEEEVYKGEDERIAMIVS